jgi:hypothetical protein
MGNQNYQMLQKAKRIKQLPLPNVKRRTMASMACTMLDALRHRFVQKVQTRHVAAAPHWSIEHHAAAPHCIFDEQCQKPLMTRKNLIPANLSKKLSPAFAQASTRHDTASENFPTIPCKVVTITSQKPCWNHAQKTNSHNQAFPKVVTIKFSSQPHLSAAHFSETHQKDKFLNIPNNANNGWTIAKKLFQPKATRLNPQTNVFPIVQQTQK